jgi:hypothetical protein
MIYQVLLLTDRNIENYRVANEKLRFFDELTNVLANGLLVQFADALGLSVLLIAQFGAKLFLLTLFHTIELNEYHQESGAASGSSTSCIYHGMLGQK